MSKLDQIMTLAKAGYKAGEIAKLLTDPSINEESGAETSAEIPEKDQAQPEPEKAIEQPESKPEESVENKQISELQDQIRQLQSQLDQAQKNNVSRDNSGVTPVDPQETLNEIMKRFM